MYVVEVSNPRLANDQGERFECGSTNSLGIRIEDCTDLRAREADEAAEFVADGEPFEWRDEETGVEVVARQQA